MATKVSLPALGIEGRYADDGMAILSARSCGVPHLHCRFQVHEPFDDGRNGSLGMRDVVGMVANLIASRRHLRKNVESGREAIGARGIHCARQFGLPCHSLRVTIRIPAFGIVCDDAIRPGVVGGVARRLGGDRILGDRGCRRGFPIKCTYFIGFFVAVLGDVFVLDVDDGRLGRVHFLHGSASKSNTIAFDHRFELAIAKFVKFVKRRPMPRQSVPAEHVLQAIVFGYRHQLAGY